MNKSFGMRHQTENISLFIANASNVHDRAVGIVRISSPRRFRFRIPLPLTAAIGQGNLAVFQQPLGKGLVTQNKTPFSMRNRSLQVP